VSERQLPVGGFSHAIDREPVSAHELLDVRAPEPGRQVVLAAYVDLGEDVRLLVSCATPPLLAL
jgi:hypothetical protein